MGRRRILAPPEVWEYYAGLEQLLYPINAWGPAVLSAAAVWTWGAWTILVPAATITRDFLITHVFIHIYSTATGRPFNIQLGEGAPAAEVPLITVDGNWWNEAIANTDGTVGHFAFTFPFPIRVAANTAISCRATDMSNNALGYRVRIGYVEVGP